MVGTEIDLIWTDAAGSSDCAEAVIADEGLETYEVAVDDTAVVLPANGGAASVGRMTTRPSSYGSRRRPVASSRSASWPFSP